MFYLSCDFSGALQTNYREKPGSCLSIQFSGIVDMADVFANGVGIAIKQKRNLLPGGRILLVPRDYIQA
jgi:hypothetical protein